MPMAMPDELRTTVLLEEYRQAMESQRANTNVVYPWLGSIFLVLSTGLFFFGLTMQERAVFLPAMILAVVLALIWLGLTETFIFYIRQEFRRIHEIERELGISLMSGIGEELRRRGWRARLVEARTYVRIFVPLYVAIWILAYFLKF